MCIQEALKINLKYLTHLAYSCMLNLADKNKHRMIHIIEKYLCISITKIIIKYKDKKSAKIIFLYFFFNYIYYSKRK